MTNKDIQIRTNNFLENTFSNDIEKMKSIVFGLENILTSIFLNLETNDDFKNYEKLIQCQCTLKKIINENKGDECNE